MFQFKVAVPILNTSLKLTFPVLAEQRQSQFYPFQNWVLNDKLTHVFVVFVNSNTALRHDGLLDAKWNLLFKERICQLLHSAQ